MKHIQKYKRFESSFESSLTEIDRLCSKYMISRYIVNDDDMSINVDGNVNLYGYHFDKLPIKFNKVSGNFICKSCNLKTLVGSPKEVGGNFDCSNNELVTLEGSPKTVSGYFECSDNKLTTLKGSPDYVGDFFDCADNSLTNLIGISMYIGDDFECSENRLTNFDGIENSNISIPSYYANNPIYYLISELQYYLSFGKKYQLSSNEILERLNEFEVINDNKINISRVNQLYDFYDSQFDEYKFTRIISMSLKPNNIYGYEIY